MQREMRQQIPDAMIEVMEIDLADLASVWRFVVLLAATSSCVVTVTSIAERMGQINFDDLMSEASYERWSAYGQSKLANVLFAYELQRRLEAAGVSTLSMTAHPGVAATSLPETPLLHRVQGYF